MQAWIDSYMGLHSPSKREIASLPPFLPLPVLDRDYCYNSMLISNLERLKCLLNTLFTQLALWVITKTSNLKHRVLKQHCESCPYI